MCLRWEDIKSFSFQSCDEDSFDIAAEVKVRWSKGATLDESAFRIILFPGLLSTSMAIQGTLRMLIMLALLDGVFSDSVQTWDDLLRLRHSSDTAKTGRVILMKPDMREVPVLRRMRDGQITNEPVTTIDMQTEVRQ